MDITRRRQGRWLGGVCAGLATRFGLSAGAVRVGVALLALAAGPPVVIGYLAAWAFLPAQEGSGLHLGEQMAGRRGPGGSAADAVAGAAVVVGAVLLLAEVSSWLPRSVLVPALLACAGAAVVWGGRSGDRGAGASAGRMRPLRVALGVSLVLVGGVAMLAAVSDVRTIGRSAAGAAVVVAGVGLMLGPGLARLARNLGDERRQRILSEERADVATHLHDGVLQTLALIQKRAADDKEVRSLARRQERELRDWLYGRRELAEPDGVADLLRRELADVEDRYGVRLDAVLVGDAPLDDAARALVAAGREAARNAATHAGVDTVDVYLEVEPERVSLFVRDRGAGFDPAAVPPDRRGLADSVVGRVRRQGGHAEVRSAPGEGNRTVGPTGESGGRGPGPGSGEEVKRVFVVDDHALVRSGVRSELAEVTAGGGGAPRIVVVGEAGDVDSAVAAIPAAAPDVVLLDVHLPGGGGAEVIRRVLAQHPSTLFLALSVSDAPEDVIAVIRAGARGYLTKSVSGPELAEAVERVAAGDAVFSPRLAGFVLDAFAGTVPIPADPELDQLTTREREVLRLIARGYAYKEVARQLSLSVKTVETHVSSVLRKLQLSSRHELTRWATERRIV